MSPKIFKYLVAVCHPSQSLISKLIEFFLYLYIFAFIINGSISPRGSKTFEIINNTYRLVLHWYSESIAFEKVSSSVFGFHCKPRTRITSLFITGTVVVVVLFVLETADNNDC